MGGPDEGLGAEAIRNVAAALGVKTRIAGGKELGVKCPARSPG